MRFLSICLLAASAMSPAAFPQSSSSSVPAAIGMLNYVHAVTDVDKTVAFYRDVFGLEVGRAPAAFPNPGVPALVNAPGVTLRMGTMKMPGAKFVLELTQFSGVERKAGQPLHTDPGAANLQLRVRDIDRVFAAIKKSGAPIITTSGMPVKIGPASGNIRSILIRDPDGFVLEVIQIPPPADAPAGAVYGVGIGLTAANLDATRKFYHDMLGFDLSAPTPFSGDKAILNMVGAPAGAEYRQMAGDVPGTNANVEFYEYKGLPRTPFHLRVPDPGAPALVLRVNDLDGMLKRLRAINTPIVSAHGQPVQFSPTVRNIFVVDPNGVNLELYESKP